MDNGAVWSDTGDGGEANLDEPRLLRAEPSQYLIDLHLGHGLALSHDGAFQPRHGMRHGGTIDNMRLAHTIHLCGILACLHGRDGILIVNELGFRDDTAKGEVGTALVDPHSVGFGRRDMPLDGRDDVVVGLVNDTGLREVSLNFLGHKLGGIAVHHNLIVRDGHVADTDRASLNISGGTNIQQVCHIIEGTEHRHGGLFLCHFFPNGLDFVGHGLTCIFQRMNSEGRGRDGGSVLPNFINKVALERNNLSQGYSFLGAGIVAVGSTRSKTLGGTIERLGQNCGKRRRMNVRVDSNSQGLVGTTIALLLCQIGQEFGNRRDLGQTLLHQLPMVGIQRQVGLVEVP
mmetsp:Transcript_19746/g.46721  ORF Transcript_19746/g.46721 Transcript_19746/m.46721 type:complete len:345 (+) Transcript_19746:866-1900(+)